MYIEVANGKYNSKDDQEAIKSFKFGYDTKDEAKKY